MWWLNKNHLLDFSATWPSPVQRRRTCLILRDVDAVGPSRTYEAEAQPGPTALVTLACKTLSVAPALPAEKKLLLYRKGLSRQVKSIVHDH